MPIITGSRTRNANGRHQTAKVPASFSCAIQQGFCGRSCVHTRGILVWHRILIVVSSSSLRHHALPSPPPAPTAHSMGICSSCLGGRRTSESDVGILAGAGACYSGPNRVANIPLQQSDSSHLLGDQYQPNYGAAGGAHNVPQPDPEELRRQRETLERICAETSE